MNLLCTILLKEGVLTLEKENESEKIERLRQKIRDFNESMEDLSEELTTIFTEGKEGQFHDVALEMIKSLDKAQETVRKAYYLFLSKNKNEN